MRAIFVPVLAILISKTQCFEFDLNDFFENNERAVETTIIILFAIILLNYIIGKLTNENIFIKFLKRTYPTLQNNFLLAGEKFIKVSTIVGQPNILFENPDIVQKTSPTNCTIFLSGHKHIQFCILNIFAKRRQNFMVSLVYSIFIEERDTLLIEFVLGNSEFPKGCLYVVRSKKQKWVKEAFDDVRLLCKTVKSSVLTLPAFTIFGENQEIADLVIDEKTVHLFTKTTRLIDSLEVSDCLTNELHRGVNIKMQLNFGSSKDVDFDNLNEKIDVLVLIAERVAKYRPSRVILDDLNQNREKFWKNYEKNKFKNKKLENKREKDANLEIPN